MYAINLKDMPSTTAHITIIRSFFLFVCILLGFNLSHQALANETVKETEAKEVVKPDHQEQAANLIDQWLNTKTNKDHEAAIKWKFAHPAPEFSILAQAWKASLNSISTETNGQLNFDIFGSGSLYGTHGGIKAIRSKISDFGTCYSASEHKGFEYLKTFYLPFVSSKNPYLNSIIINELAEQYISPEFLKKGVYLAHVIPFKPLSLMSKEPIRTPSDLKGKKVLSFMHIAGAAERLGYTDIKLPFTEIYTALQQGIIDVVIWADIGFIPFKIYELAKHYTELNISSLGIETCFNRRSFDKLPKNLKQQLHDGQQKLAMVAISKEETYSKQAKQVLKEKNVTILSLTADEYSQWQTSLLPTVDNWIKECEKRGKDCRGLIKDIESLKNKYQSLSNEELIQRSFNHPVQGVIQF